MTITPLWKAGFETGDLREFTSTSGAIAVSTTQKKTGTYALRLNQSNNDYGDKTLATSQARVGFHYYPTENNTTTFEAFPFRFMNATTNLFGVAIDDSGTTMKMFVSGSVVATATAPVYRVWQHWGLEWKASATAGWAKLYIDGALILEYTGNTGSTAAAFVRVGGGTNGFQAYAYIDDIYVDDTTGESVAYPPPDKRFAWHVLAADVTKQFTPSTGSDHYALLDEVPVSATDYVSTTAAGSVDTFTLTSVSYPAGFVVAAVWPTAEAFKSDGALDSRLTFRITDGVDTTDSATQALPTTVDVVTARFALQPDGTPWDNAAVDSLTVGFVSSGDFV